MELHDIVIKLVGPIEPIGETQIDSERLENLRVMTRLIDKLLYDISLLTYAANRHEASMQAIGIHARDFLNAIKDAD